MIKILFLIHDLGQGGAEKVLVNLVNNMDKQKFDITVIALFGGGVNEQFLKPHIHFKCVWPKMIPGNSKIMKLLSPEQLHNRYIKEKYDVEISYLEGPSARVISGCTDKKTKLISWIHVEQHTMEALSYAFRNTKEAENSYNKFDKIICVSEFVKRDFCSIMNCTKEPLVLYNTVESDKIIEQAKQEPKRYGTDSEIKIIAVGTLKESKGYRRMLQIIKKLKQGNYPIHLYILGEGPMRGEIEEIIQSKELSDTVTLLGYTTNPYQYISRSDLFICASYAEGFSTAVTEALILGVPVCTVNVSGMKELLGNHNEYGIVTENDKVSLYKGIKKLLDDRTLLDSYKQKAKIRGKSFETKKTVDEVEKMILKCMEEK